MTDALAVDSSAVAAVTAASRPAKTVSVSVVAAPTHCEPSTLQTFSASHAFIATTACASWVLAAFMIKSHVG